MLTLKTKEFFFKHILEKYNYTESDFHQLPLVCQQALVVEFFDSVGILIDVDLVNSDGGFTAYICHEKHRLPNGKTLTTVKNYNTRPEALSKAISKADELFNLNNE